MMRRILLACLLVPGVAVAGPVPAPYSPPYTSITQRAPTPNDDVNAGCVVGKNWIYGGRTWTATSCTAGAARWTPTAAVALPLDAVSGCYGWGVRKLRAAYSGNLMTLSNGTTTQGISTLADGSMDNATADAFWSANQATAYVSALNEQSASGYTATGAALSSAPIWNNTNQVGNSRGIVFNSVANGITNQAATQKYLSFPTLAWTPSNSTVFIVAQQRSAAPSRGLIEAPAGAVTFLSDFYQANAAPTVRLSNGHGTCLLTTENGASVLGLNWATTTSSCQSNNLAVSGGTAAASSAYTGGNIGSSLSASPAGMTVDAVVLCPSALSASNFSAEMTSLESLFAIQPQDDTIVVSVGDSSTVGTGSLNDNSFPKIGMPLINRPAKFYNLSLHGISLVSMLSLEQYQFQYAYKASARDYVVHILAGANDIRSGTSVATIKSTMQSYVAYLKALGPNVRVVVATEMLQCDIFQNSTWLAAEQSLNNWIIANWNLPQSLGGIGADGLDNQWADPTVGPGNYTSSAFCGSPNSISPDGQHPTDYAMNIQAVPFAASINAVLH